jgi:hypothetical protein
MKKKQKNKKNKEIKRRVPRRAISAGHRVQDHNPSCYKWARRDEESKLPSLLYDPFCACSHGTSRKEQRICACSRRAGVNGRARKHAGVRLYRARKHERARAGLAGGGRERTLEQIADFQVQVVAEKSAIAFHALVVRVREAPF